jgi:hypothetical protein
MGLLKTLKYLDFSPHSDKLCLTPELPGTGTALLATRFYLAR